MKVLLMLVILNGSGSYEYEYPMSDWNTCIKAVESSKSDIAKGGDAEQGFVLFCTKEDE